MGWKQLPIWFALGLLTLQAFAELAAMVRSGSWQRQRHPEWTFQAVNLPYRLMFAAGVMERYWVPLDIPPWKVVGGATAVAIGILIRIVSHIYLGYYFSPFVELDEAHRLQQCGVYRYMRHPMYLGTLMITLGTPVLTASWWAGGFALLAIVGLVLRLRKEERFLQQNLAGFDEYASRTWALVPGIW